MQYYVILLNVNKIFLVKHTMCIYKHLDKIGFKNEKHTITLTSVFVSDSNFIPFTLTSLGILFLGQLSSFNATPSSNYGQYEGRGIC